MMIGRIALSDISPVVAGGQFSARAVAGGLVPIEATVVREGHGLVGVTATARGPHGRTIRSRLGLITPGLDRYAGALRVDAEGSWTLRVEGWADPIASWRHGIEAKVAADVDVTLELEEGALLLERAAPGVPAARRKAVLTAALRLRDESLDVHSRLAESEHPALIELLWAHPLRELVTVSGRYPLWVDRPRAEFSTWYELFPRSEGGLVGATARLTGVAAMNFDVVYLPPIHPIGSAFRKGPNNTLEPAAGDPGSPWAIGSAAGGHDAIDPALGTFADFDAFVARAAELHLEVALDLALQCSPDHPWVTEHPEWFSHRIDGSIAYAENPPKKYQDIYPLDFDVDPEGLFTEVLRICRLWMSHGVRIFRVDNPHTKPLAFWERLIAAIKATDPDVLFLAEAFTRPPMMHLLAQVGFSQSYTYFTWRTAKWEIEEYLTDLTQSPTADYMRPNLWPNTPDILPAYLQYAGPAAFKIRSVLAGTLSPSYGIYSGYELYENLPLRPGTEEYLDSEKYQVRVRDYAAEESAGRSLAPYLARLNEVRRAHPALQRLRGLRFHTTNNEAILAYSRQDAPDATDVVLVVVNLDPRRAHEAVVSVDLTAFGWDSTTSIMVRDQLGQNESWVWGASNYVRLDPNYEPAHLFVVART